MIHIQTRHERNFQDRLIRAFERHGAVARHYEPESGFPDLFVAFGDRYILLELKSVPRATGARFSSLFEDGQLAWLARHKDLGMNVASLIELRDSSTVILYNPSTAREVEEGFDLTVCEISNTYPVLHSDIVAERMMR